MTTIFTIPSLYTIIAIMTTVMIVIGLIGKLIC